MCTNIVSNKNRTVVGWNLDILDMKHKVLYDNNGVYINVYDKIEGWMPIFGANSRGDFVAMPTCWPFDDRSDPKNGNEINIINLDVDLLMMKKTLSEVLETVKSQKISSVPGVTFMSQLSDKDGNVLQIIPGQGYRFLEKPELSIMTNFSPFKGDREKHPWMGLDRYNAAKEIAEKSENFGVDECFEALRAASQTVCPTVVSMVYDVEAKTVYWCEDRQWDKFEKKIFV